MPTRPDRREGQGRGTGEGAFAEPERPTIAELVEVASIDTVVRLDGRGDRLGELVLTGDVVRSLETVIEATSTHTGAGFFVVGHFGSGKSHFLAALGELLSDPARAQGLTGWSPALQSAAGAVRPSLAVAVPLVEHRVEARLEDLVLARGWRALGRTPPLSGTDRTAAWDALLGVATEAGRSGLILLIDELSEFLRAKQGPGLTEDLRFLQFLGEWAARRPVVVVAALQESIEEVANVSQRELARIRDRYRPSLTLSMRHVEDLVRGRLVRLLPGAERWVERAHADIGAAFPDWGVPLHRLVRCYPLHPETLTLLEGLRYVLSQQRGVVDFICRQLGGDATAGIAPWVTHGYRELLTPERVYDHFRARLGERVESARLAETVVPYYERAVAECFEDAEDRDLALRAVKLLTLLAASPLERPRTAAELAAMLLSSVSDLDPAANVSYLENAILAPMVARGAYLVARPAGTGGTGAGAGGTGAGAGGTGAGATTYAVEVEADAALVALARVAQARAELARVDQRVLRTVMELGSSPVLPLALMVQLGVGRREMLWQHTLRSVLVGVGRLSELTAADVTDHVRSARAAGAEACLLIGELEPEGDDDELAELARRLVSAGRFACWVPAVPTPAERELLLDLHAHRVVLDHGTARGVRAGEVGGLVEHLQRLGEADAARAREVLRRCYFGGQVISPGPVISPGLGGGAGPDLPSLAGLAFERQLPSLVDGVLSSLHPRHHEVAPRGDLVGERIVRQLVTEVLAHPRLPGGAGAGQLRSLAQSYLGPLGLVRRRGDSLVVAPDPVRSPAVSEVLRLVAQPVPTGACGGVAAGPPGAPVTGVDGGDGTVLASEVLRDLADGPVGLTEPESILVLNACVQAGLLEAWRGRRRLCEPFVVVTATDRLGTGELVEPGLRGAIATLAPIAGPGPFDPWTVSVQRAAWDQVRSWADARREEIAQVASGRDRLADAAVLAEAVAGPLGADVELLGAVVEACDVRLAPAQGLRALVQSATDPGELLAAARRVGATARFVREELGNVERAVAYLTHPDLVIPPGEQGLAKLRDQALGLAREILTLACEDRVGDFLAASRELRNAYAGEYRAAHDSFYSSVRPKDLEAVRTSPGYRALAALSGLGAMAVPDDRIKVDRALMAAAPQPCTRRVDLELAWKPTCGCGFVLGQAPPSFDPGLLVSMAERGVRQHLAELARPENRERLEAASVELASLGREELAEDLRGLLVLLDEPAGVASRSVATLLSGPLSSVMRDVLRGAQLVVKRDLAALREDVIGRRYPKRRLLELVEHWVDPSGDVPLGGFVEVTDSHDGAPGFVGATSASPGAGAGTRAPGATVAPEHLGEGQVQLLRNFLDQRFPSLVGVLPPDRAADAFWLAVWWAGRPQPPSWIPAALLSEVDLVCAAGEAAMAAGAGLAELADLDRRVGPNSVLGDQVGAALDLGAIPATQVAGILTGERLLRHPVRLAANELARRLAADWQLGRCPVDLHGLAGLHALIDEAELAALGHLLAVAAHLSEVELSLAELTCRSLVEELYPRHVAPVAGLLSRAQLAAAGPSLLDVGTLDLVCAAAARSLRPLDEVLKVHAGDGFPGCMKLWEVGRSILEPLLFAHQRVAVLLVDAMRVDLWQRVRPLLELAWPQRPVVEAWAVVAAPTRTAEAVACLYSGQPVPPGGAPGGPGSARPPGGPGSGQPGRPFSHLGYEAVALVRADGDQLSQELRALWASGPPISVAVATGVDERLHHTSVELAALLDDSVAALERRVIPSLAALPDHVPLVVLADHGFRENPAWGHGPEGRYVHGGVTLQECVVPVVVLGALRRGG